jgi:hypothetical protein
MKRLRAGSALVGFLGVVLGATLPSGCSNEGTTQTPSSETPSPVLTTTLLVQGDFDLPAGQGGTNQLVRASKAVSFTSDAPGDLQAQVDWTHTSNTIAVGFYPAGCKKQQFGVGACKPLAYRHPPGTYNENVANFASAPAGQYVLGIQNHGAKAESGAYHVVLVH